MYQVTQDFNDKMRADMRMVQARVTVDYTDPTLDQSIGVSVTEQANVSYPAQTADGVSAATYKWASLDGSWVLDGSYHLAPEPQDLTQYQFGWWSAKLAGTDGSFSTPYPSLMVTHIPRPVHTLRVVGDSARDEYPVNFHIDLYGPDGTLLRSQTVTGNAVVEWSMVLPSPVLDVARQVLTVTKWSHTGRQAKILEFFTSIQETYESGDVVEIKLLEEREASQGSLPVGNITANEISIRLANEGGKFDPTNPNSPLYRLLKPNRRIRAWLGITGGDQGGQQVSKTWDTQADWQVGALTSTQFNANGDLQIGPTIKDDFESYATGSLEPSGNGVWIPQSVDSLNRWAIGTRPDTGGKALQAIIPPDTNEYSPILFKASSLGDNGLDLATIEFTVVRQSGAQWGGLYWGGLYFDIISRWGPRDAYREANPGQRYLSTVVPADGQPHKVRCEWYLDGNGRNWFRSYLDGALVMEDALRDANGNPIAYAWQNLYFGFQSQYYTTSTGSIYYDDIKVWVPGAQGIWRSPSIDLSPVGTAATSRISWDADTPASTSVTVEASLDGGQTWYQCTDGGPVPGIDVGDDLTGKQLLVRATLATQESSKTPTLRSLTVTVNHEEWVPLGAFWSLDWDSPDDSLEASVVARDRLELLRKSTYQPGQVQQNVSLYTLAEQVLQDAGLSPSDYWIDPALQSIVVPWAWLSPTSHREALRIIAEAALAVVYADRDGVIRIETMGSVPAEPVLEITADDYFPPLRAPAKQESVANEIIVTTQPLVPAATPEEVYRSTTPITVPAGQTVTVTVQYTQVPVIQASASLDAPPAGVSITAATYYAWGAEVSIQNSSASQASVTLVITGKPLSVQGGEQVVVRDEASILENGVLRYEYPANPLVQTLSQAQAIANALLASAKDPRRDIEVEWRGNPALELGDRVTVVGQDVHVIRQEITWAGAMSARITGRKVT